jgi:subtilisin family serine protease
VSATRTEAPYSSRGPTADGRFKPNILAPTGAGNAASAGAFGGTSAAAPHVTAALALLLEAFPGADAARLTTLLQTRAVGVPPVADGSGARRLHPGSLLGVGPLLPQGAEEARITGNLPSGAGVALAVYQGPDAYPARFTHLLVDLRPVRSIWRFDSSASRWQGYVADAPSWVNVHFNTLNNNESLVLVLGAR